MNPFDVGKMLVNAQKTKSKLKKIRAAGVSKDQTVGILIDATMNIVEVEVKDEAMQLKPAKLSANIIEAFGAAQKELEKVMRNETSLDDLKDMLGM